MPKERYVVIKENAETELYAIYVPELEDAAEAVKILNERGNLWKESNLGQRNRLLLAIFESFYVGVDSGEVVGTRPRKDFTTLMRASMMRASLDREDVEIRSTPYREFTRDGGDGGESHSPSRNSPDRMYYKLVRRFSLAVADSRRRDSATASRLSLWPCLSASPG